MQPPQSKCNMDIFIFFSRSYLRIILIISFYNSTKMLREPHNPKGVAFKFKKSSKNHSYSKAPSQYQGTFHWFILPSSNEMSSKFGFHALELIVLPWLRSLVENFPFSISRKLSNILKWRTEYAFTCVALTTTFSFSSVTGVWPLVHPMYTTVTKAPEKDKLYKNPTMPNLDHQWDPTRNHSPSSLKALSNAPK